MHSGNALSLSISTLQGGVTGAGFRTWMLTLESNTVIYTGRCVYLCKQYVCE